MFPYQLKKEKRKSLTIEVNAEGVIVKAPVWATLKEIEAFVDKKQEWIEKKVRELRNKKERAAAMTQGKALYKGELYPIIYRDQRPALIFDGAFHIKKELAPLTKELLKRWYKKKAEIELKSEVTLWAQRCSLKPKAVRISYGKAVWGSCSPKGIINLSWRLILAPEETISAIVVHELVHLRHRDHSKNFYKLVERCFPMYKKAERWLSDVGIWIDL